MSDHFQFAVSKVLSEDEHAPPSRPVTGGAGSFVINSCELGPSSAALAKPAVGCVDRLGLKAEEEKQAGWLDRLPLLLDGAGWDARAWQTPKQVRAPL